MKVYPDLEKLKEPKLKIEYNSFSKDKDSLKHKDKIHPFNNKVNFYITLKFKSKFGNFYLQNYLPYL